MEKRYKTYIYRLGIISIIVLLGSVGLFLTLLKEWFNWIYPFVILYFFLFNSLQHYRLLKIVNKDPRVFNTHFMAWFGIKLFLHLSFVVLFVLLNKAQALSFVLFFGACYLIYSVVEVVALSSTLRSGDVK